MDGAQNTMSRSLYLRLATWLSACIVMVAIAAGIFSFVEVMDDAHDLQDDFLRQAAVIAANHTDDNAYVEPVNIDWDDDLDEDESHLIIQRLRAENAKNSSSLKLPDTLQNGLQTIQIGKIEYRVMVKQLPSGQRIAVAQETKLRNEIARSSAMHTILPLVLLIPILVLLVIIIVYRALRPVARLAQEVDKRNDTQLHSLPQQQLPSEIVPFVNAINRLLARVEQSMKMQRRFVADAAHELRSPLTALSLQAHRLTQSEMSAEAHTRLNTLQQGIERGRKLLDQLLTLARSQDQTHQATQQVSVRSVYRHVLEELMPLAEAKHIDLGLLDGADVHITVNELEAATVIKNLVDNAIRYSPNGSQIDLSVHTHINQVVLAVEDNGTGIASEERTRVLDPFYRIAGSEQTGSGLGLSIVKTIVERWGGTVSLSEPQHFRHGLRVSITVPIHARTFPNP